MVVEVPHREAAPHALRSSDRGTRTRGDDDKHENWLLFKGRDEAADEMHRHLAALGPIKAPI